MRSIFVGWQRGLEVEGDGEEGGEDRGRGGREGRGGAEGGPGVGGGRVGGLRQSYSRMIVLILFSLSQ